VIFSKLYSICKLRCPKCLKGPFFESSVYDFKKLGNVRRECPKCKVNYIPEPGFYFGAMYVSYALGVIVFVTIWAGANWFFTDVSVWTQIIILTILIILLSPLIFALSKIIYANIFIHYDKETSNGVSNDD
tara:strand:- start:1087 stop:1479 length:393 start_codon:yes stop_codon:yes gene_type:complete